MDNPPLFPRKGQIWEATNECGVQIQYLFSAPITFTGAGTLPAGERVSIITAVTEPHPLFVSFEPVQYQPLHERFVPADIRDTPRFKRYRLSVKTEDFHQYFKLIEDAAAR